MTGRPSLVRRAFTENLRYKLVALCLALALFAVVNTARTEVRWMRVEVNYTVAQERALVRQPPSTVEISVRGSWRKINEIAEQGLPPVTVAVSDEPSSEFLVRDLIALPPGAQYVSAEPRILSVRTEPRASRMVPVTVTLEGLPKQGFEVTKAVAQPSLVRVSGADSVIQDIAQVPTYAVRLDERTSNASETVSLKPPGELTSVEPATIKVELSISERVIEKELGAVQVVLQPPSLTPTPDFSPKKVKVIARGAGAALASLPKLTAVARVPEETASVAPVVIEPAVAGVSFEVIPPTVVLSPVER